MSGTTLLKAERLTVGYGRQAVLSDLDFCFDRGAFTGLVGANGSGKSTLLRTVLGIQPPLGGRLDLVPLDGRVPVLGYVPQREALDGAFLVSGREVVLMGACGRVGPGRFFPREEFDWANRCLDEVEAGDLARRRFSELSGGQKQRVLIARALAAKPDLLLLDEPTTGIDAATTRSILDLLRRLHERDGLTIVMVNHDLRAVRRLVGDVILIREGRLVRGPVEELLRQEHEDGLELY